MRGLEYATKAAALAAQQAMDAAMGYPRHRPEELTRMGTGIFVEHAQSNTTVTHSAPIQLDDGRYVVPVDDKGEAVLSPARRAAIKDVDVDAVRSVEAEAPRSEEAVRSR